MFSRDFLAQVIEPSAAGQPHIVAVAVLGAAHLMSGHLAFYNSGAATLQILIGSGLLSPRTVKPALLASFAWALGVWTFGEGLGLLLTGQANPATGAPGAALLYVLAGLLVWPVNRPARHSPASQWLLNDDGGRLLWANLWLGFAALSLLPANITSSAASGAFVAGGSMAPGPLAHLDAALGRLSAGRRVRGRNLGYRRRGGRPGHRAGHRPEFRSSARPAFRSCLHASCQPIPRRKRTRCEKDTSRPHWWPRSW
jgi:hypothetical protein